MAMWQVQEAKTRLSELIEKANSSGPQIITRHGAERAVVLSIRDYRALTAHKPDLRAYLLGGPKVDSFDVEREINQAGTSVCERSIAVSARYPCALGDAEEAGRRNGDGVPGCG